MGAHAVTVVRLQDIDPLESSVDCRIGWWIGTFNGEILKINCANEMSCSFS
jgi:hypothetical protein